MSYAVYIIQKYYLDIVMHHADFSCYEHQTGQCKEDIYVEMFQSYS